MALLVLRGFYMKIANSPLPKGFTSNVGLDKVLQGSIKYWFGFTIDTLENFKFGD